MATHNSKQIAKSSLQHFQGAHSMPPKSHMPSMQGVDMPHDPPQRMSMESPRGMMETMVGNKRKQTMESPYALEDRRAAARHGASVSAQNVDHENPGSVQKRTRDFPVQVQQQTFKRAVKRVQSAAY